MSFLRKQKVWILPTIIVLFILEILTFPLVVSLTYAGKSESPEHIITYNTGKLIWDDNTKVRADGTGELTLFDTLYQNVNSDNGEKVLAPGTEGDNIVRLHNKCGNEVTYTAIMYTIRSVGNLPVVAVMDGDGNDTEDFSLPNGIEKDSVVKALSGKLSDGQIADFNIDWHWTFEQGTEQDIIDTAFGDKAAQDEADNVVMGIYIVVEDQGSKVRPNPPKTGDDTVIFGYITLCAISFIAIILLLITDRKKRKEDESCIEQDT